MSKNDIRLAGWLRRQVYRELHRMTREYRVRSRQVRIYEMRFPPAVTPVFGFTPGGVREFQEFVPPDPHVYITLRVYPALRMPTVRGLEPTPLAERQFAFRPPTPDSIRFKIG